MPSKEALAIDDLTEEQLDRLADLLVERIRMRLIRITRVTSRAWE